MTKRRYHPPNLSDLDHGADVQALAFELAGGALTYVFDWIMKGDLQMRSLRFHLVVLCVCPEMLPCKRPSAAWCARIHGVCHQKASRLQQEFTRELGEHIRFRGQRFGRQTKGTGVNPTNG